MTKRSVQPDEARLTPAPLSTVPPRSGPFRRTEQWTEHLLTTANNLPADLPLDAAVGHLLGPFLDLEDGAVVVVTLVEPGGEPRLIERGALVPGTGGELRGRADSFVVPLPGLDGSNLCFWAPAYLNAPRDHYHRISEQAAGIVSLFVRALRPTSSLDDTRLAQLEKLATIGQTAAEIVHELNNPLTAILAYSEYLGKRLGERGVGDADVDRVLRIHEAASRIQHFCRDLTDYSRPASALRTSVDIHAVIDRALRFCMHGLRSANITVERIYRDVPRVSAVESALTQVFVNLITNASHAMAMTGGTLSIRTSWRADLPASESPENGWVVVEVADEGHGIDDEHRAKIFDLYFTTKPAGAGVGLGLAIVRQIIEAHGGHIDVGDCEPRGTAFTIELPTLGE